MIVPYAGLPAIGLGWNKLTLPDVFSPVCRPLVANAGKSELSRMDESFAVSYKKDKKNYYITNDGG